MSTETLSKLFSSAPLVKIMRLFLNNPKQGFEKSDIASRSKIKSSSVQTELNLLKSVGMIEQMSFYKEFPAKTKKKSKSKKAPKMIKKRVRGWVLKTDFPYYRVLRSLLVDTDTFTDQELKKRLRPAGDIKLLVVSGVFMHDDSSRVDLFVAGDRLRKKTLDEIVRNIEADIGREITYVALPTKEFIYRLEMHDKLISDILDFPHRKIVDSVKIR